MIIYKATNKVNGKCYIGQTKHGLEDRKKGHKNSAFSLNSPSRFSNALRKYGFVSFEWEVIDTAKDSDELTKKERYWIKKFKSALNGYNTRAEGTLPKKELNYVQARIQPDLYKKLQFYCVENETSIQEVVETLIKKLVDKKEKE